MRLFIAVPLSEDESRAVHELQESLRTFFPFSSFRWIPPCNIHMTLRFFGDISEKEASAAADALDSACLNGKRFSFLLERLGVFPRSRNPGVLWVGPREEPQALLELVKSIEVKLQGAGFSSADRPFRAHLTLARRKRTATPLKGVNEALREAERKWLSPPTSVWIAEVILFRSELRPEGAAYIPLHRVSLTA